MNPFFPLCSHPWQKAQLTTCFSSGPFLWLLRPLRTRGVSDISIHVQARRFLHFPSSSSSSPPSSAARCERDTPLGKSIISFGLCCPCCSIRPDEGGGFLPFHLARLAGFLVVSPVVIAHRASTLQNGISLPVITDVSTETKSIPLSRPFFSLAKVEKQAIKQAIKRTAKISPHLSKGGVRSCLLSF